jgi:hypothetical protein
MVGVTHTLFEEAKVGAWGPKQLVWLNSDRKTLAVWENELLKGFSNLLSEF